MNNTPTEFVMTLNDYKTCYSDMHKDAYGYRPRYIPENTLEEWEFEFSLIRRRIQDNFSAQLASEEQAKKDFDALVAKLIKQGAKDEDMAIRWIHDAHGVGDDSEYLCYQLGLPYGYFRRG